MENAGRQVVAAIESVHSDLVDRKVAILCGRGNNGGDGFVVARTMMQRGIDVSVFVIGASPRSAATPASTSRSSAGSGISVVEIADSQAWELHFTEISDCTLIVDAIFGTGLNAPLSGLMETVVADVNGAAIPVIAIDLPSGLSADTHEPIGDSIEAGMTVTLARAEAVARAAAGRDARRRHRHRRHRHSGRRHRLARGPQVHLMTRGAMRELLTPRMPDTHKGDYGRVLIVAGSRGKTGAAHLSALGALESGAGLVTVATARAACRSSRQWRPNT